MLRDQTIGVVIPALNEEHSIGQVLSALPEFVDKVVVVDNGSTDQTAAVAARNGARVVHEPRRGYGAACLAGIVTIADHVDILVFLDADLSDHPEQLTTIVEPIAAGRADLVIGSRTLGHRERGALNLPQRFGNALACTLIRWFWNYRYTDLGPFRAIRTDALAVLRMDDLTFGWTVQMQVRALRAGLRATEVPVNYRRRIGRSKISGTLSGILRAGAKIIGTILEERWRPCTVPPWSPSSDHVIVFTRYPRPGQTKTRMIPALGPEGAADLQRQMTLHTLAIIDRLDYARNISHDVRYTGGSHADLSRAFGTDRVYRRQHTGELGERLDGALAEAFTLGAKAVVAIGCDCPPLDPEALEAAFDELQRCDSVVGPARDGGYYLIGLRQPRSALFSEIAWGTGNVLEQTLARASELGLTVATLPVLDDVDEPADLPAWHAHRERYLRREQVPGITVVIPTLNETAYLARAIQSAQQADDVEVIVVDGGSSDETTRIAITHGAMVVPSPPGRGRQMNAGAAAARGRVLLFLHADSVLPLGYRTALQRALDQPEVALTAFRLAIDPDTPPLRRVAWLANLRSRVLGMPYGDQALAIRAPLFRRMKGFQDWPLMEDFEFVRRARRYGRVHVLDEAVRTSGRRWLSCGVVRTTMVHQVCILGYFCGVSPERLARWRDGTAAAAKIRPVTCGGHARGPVPCSCGKRLALSDPTVSKEQIGECVHQHHERTDEVVRASGKTRS